MTAAELLIQELQQRGVEWMATLCGHGLDPLFHAARRAGMRLVDTRNEQTAAYLAECYGRLTRRPGVCAVSSGVAHVNALTGVCNAFFDGAPMLLISGAGALATAGKGHFQDLDQAALAAPITTYARVIDQPEHTGRILDEAWRAAQRGPAHLTFPMDIQESPAAPCGTAAPDSPLDLPPARWPACARPLIVAGSGVYYSGAGAELLEFSLRHSIPIVTPIWDRGIVDQPSDTWCGVIGAASGGPRLLPDADCILMAGAAADYRVNYLNTTAPVLHMDRGFRNIRCDREYPEWRSEARRRHVEFRRSVEERGAGQAAKSTHAIHILAALREVLTPEAVLLIDGGSIGQWAHQLLCGERYPGHWLTCGRSGVVGYGIAGAMAARLAYPDRPVILLSGDGAFTFNVAELECAVRQRLPFVALVADDQAWGITRTGHLRQFGEAIGSALGPIAFDRLAESLGARGVGARRPEDIAPALREALGAGTVTVIHVPVSGGNPA